MTGKPPRILLESTCSFDTRFTTGIQRVVRSVVAESQAIGEQLDLECVPVVFRKDRFYDARHAWRRRTVQSRDGAQSLRQRLACEIERLSPRASQLAAAARIRARKLFYPKTLARRLTNTRWQLGARPITLGPSDILLLLDETWRLPIWSTLDEARDRGCRVGSVIYDLIPIDHPQFFQTEFVSLFTEGLQTQVNHSDFFLPISEAVADRLRAHLPHVPPVAEHSEKPVAAFQLGAATANAPVRGAVRSRVQQLFGPESQTTPFLCVGTLEPRKNHLYLLDAFEAVWQQDPSIPLCIVGRVGWKCQQTVERIHNHPRFGTSLFLFTDLSDAELFTCYRRAQALITCSVDEGYGLPVVEGLRHGLTVLASDIPVHREVGRQACRYVDLADPRSLARCVLDVQRSDEASPPQATERFETTSWRESTRDLLLKALDMGGNRSGHTPNRHAAA